MQSRPCSGSGYAQRTNDIEGAAVEAAMRELVSLVKEHCGGEVSWCLVDRDHPWAVMG